MRTYKLILDRKNQEVLVKKLYGQKMNKTETKRLHRTNRIIQNTNAKIQTNIRNEKKANKIFF